MFVGVTEVRNQCCHFEEPFQSLCQTWRVQAVIEIGIRHCLCQTDNSRAAFQNLKDFDVTYIPVMNGKKNFSSTN
jgi:hypothetical protein